MGVLFSNPKTLKQVIREQKRVNNRAIRSLDREIRTMDREMKKAQKDMKKLAEEQQMNAVKILAKDYMRMQQSRTRFIELKAQLRSLSSQMEVMHAQGTVWNFFFLFKITISDKGTEKKKGIYCQQQENSLLCFFSQLSLKNANVSGEQSTI